MHVAKEVAGQLPSLGMGRGTCTIIAFPGLISFRTAQIKADPSGSPKPGLAQDQASSDPGRRSPSGAGWRLLSSPPPPWPLRSSDIMKGGKGGEVPKIKASEDESPNLVFPLKKDFHLFLGRV